MDAPPEVDFGGLDAVTFSYVLGVLEDLGPSDPSEENFAMEAFTKMMEAYMPGFTRIPRGTLGDMMPKLSGQLSGTRSKENLNGRALRSKVRLLSPQSNCSSLKGLKKGLGLLLLLLGTPKTWQWCQGGDAAGDGRTLPYPLSGVGPMGAGQVGGTWRKLVDAGSEHKGEQLKDVRTPEAEEMKAVRSNLQPARKYCIH
ncbi:hypothetical protein CB1_001550002 [Camelus ferus]|nr:hypothetical protein CB1_001550002 [Camelus ferus]